MTEMPTAMSPHDQPAVNQLTAQCRVISPTITARNWRTQASALSKNIHQLFILTGDANLSGYMD